MKASFVVTFRNFTVIKLAGIFPKLADIENFFVQLYLKIPVK